MKFVKIINKSKKKNNSLYTKMASPRKSEGKRFTRIPRLKRREGHLKKKVEKNR